MTNTGAALAVPDWPTTFGYNMFLYPWSQMVGGIFYEHSHRLLGSLVGMLTLALAASRSGVKAGTLRVLGLVAVGAVIVQGVLGGLRVVLLKETLAIVHGCLAQAFFALAVAVAVLTSAPAPPARAGRSIPALRRLTLAAAARRLRPDRVRRAPHARGMDRAPPDRRRGRVRVRADRDGAAAPAPATRSPRPPRSVLVVLLGLQLLLGIGQLRRRASRRSGSRASS